eukprot:1540741-Pyramimonas_sp.AAC.1
MCIRDRYNGDGASSSGSGHISAAPVAAGSEAPVAAGGAAPVAAGGAAQAAAGSAAPEAAGGATPVAAGGAAPVAAGGAAQVAAGGAAPVAAGSAAPVAASGAAQVAAGSAAQVAAQAAAGGGQAPGEEVEEPAQRRRAKARAKPASKDRCLRFHGLATKSCAPILCSLLGWPGLGSASSCALDKGQQKIETPEERAAKQRKKDEQALVKAAETKAKAVLATYQTAVNTASTFLSAMNAMPEWKWLK